MKVNTLFLALMVLSSVAWGRVPAPAADCLDARAVERVRAIDENTLVVAAANGRFVVAHATGCDAQQPSSLVAEQGWVCGADKEFVRSGETLCPVISVSRVDARVYAGLAAAADRRAPVQNGDGSVTLNSVEVTATAAKARGFRGDTDYCFAPVAVRGWQFERGEIVVQTSPRRAGGNRSYRVELTTSCPELEWAESIGFESGVGIGMICGHPGDHALVLDQSEIPGTESRGPPQLSRTSAARNRIDRCQIAAVYPID